MPKNKFKKNIPDGWKFNSIGNVLDYEQPIPYLVQSTNYNNNHKIPVLTAGKTFILGYTDEKNGIFTNTPVIIFDDFTTAIKYVDFHFKVKSSAMKILKRKNGTVNLKFVYGWMQIHPFQVGEHKRNYLSEYQYQDVLLPPLFEQNCIVLVLETWDECLEELSKKIEIKKNIRKGLMQKLLMCKVRLKGFNGEWEVVRLDDVGKTYQGITGKNKDDFGKGKQFISYMNIYSNSKLNTQINNLVDIKDNEKQNKAKYGDLFFTTSSETPNEVGISSVLLDRNVNNLYLNSFCFGFRLNNFEVIIPEFAQFYFRGQDFRKQMTRIAQGASRFNLSKKYFLETRIKIPKSQEEQKAIAKVLTTADQEIEALEKKKKIIEAQKKYLLNNLITGKIRIPV